MILGKKVAVLFVLALLIICIVGVQSYLAIRQVNEANRIVIQTQSIQEDLEDILSMLKDAETGQRGFMLTGKDSYLAPYSKAVDEIPKQIDGVNSLILNDPEQQRNIELLRKLSRDKLSELEETIKLRRDTGMEAALSVIRQDHGKQIMDDIRTLIDQMISLESKLLDRQKQIVGDTTRQSILMVGFGVLLALIALGAAVFVLTRTMKLADRSPSSGDSGRNWKRIAIRYFFATVIVTLATVLRLWLERTFGPMPLFITWYPSVLLTAIVAGGWPGIFATILSVLIADYWFIQPEGFGISAINDAIATGIFFGTGIFLSVFAERLKRARLAEAVSVTQKKELALLNMGNLMTLDIDHRILNWSEGNHKLYGFNAQEVSGQLTYEILQTKFDQPMEEIHRELIESNHWEGEVTRITRNGARLSVALLWALRRDENGKPLAILEVSTDLTRQKLAEEALRQQAEELAQQNEELHAQSEELAQQSEELSEQNEELQTQSEEIQSLNTQLTHREGILEILLDAARLPIGEHEVMEKICRAALQMIGSAARGAVVSEALDSELRILACAGFDDSDVPDSWPLKGSFVEMIMQQGRTGALEDASLRPDFNLLPVAGLPRFAAVLSSPLHINGKNIGAVSLYSDKPQQWTAEQFRLIEWLAAECSKALGAIRLAEEVSQSRKQNDFLAGIIQSSSQAFGVGYPDGRLGLINRAFEELTGYSGEELRAIDWSKTLTPPEWFEIERKRLEALHCTDLPVRYEKEYIRKDGTRVPIELLVHLIKDKEGQPLYYYSFINDITDRKKAEAELKIREGQLSLFIEHSPASLAMFDREMRYLSASRSWRTDHNLKNRDLRGFSHYEIFPEIPQYWKDAHRRGLDGEIVRSESDRFDRADGTVEWIKWEVRPWYDAAGKVGGIIMFSVDITEIKRRDDELKRFNRTLRALSDTGKAIVHADDEDILLTEACRIIVEDCGYPMTWIGFAEADPMKTVKPVAQAGFEADYLKTVKITWSDNEFGHGPTGTAIRTGGPSVCKNILTDPRMLPWRKHASERGYASSIALPITIEGRTFGAFTIYSREPESFSDDEIKLLAELVNELSYGILFHRLREAHRQSESELKESQARLDLALRASNMGVWHWDVSENRRSFDNQACRLLGIAQETCKGTEDEFFNAVHTADREMIRNALTRTIRDNTPYEVEYRVSWPDGAIHFISSRGRLARNDDGEPLRLDGLIWDITERKHMEEELRRSRDELEQRVRERTAELSSAVTMLEQANMELQEFTHVTSHDLQEPLRKIQTFCDMIKTRSSSSLDSSGLDYFNRVLSSVQRMRQLLNDLLQLSRMIAKPEPFKAIDLDRIAHEAADLFEEELMKSGGKIEIDAMPVIDADETQILRLFQNLIGNAVKYRDEKSPLIRIFSRIDGNTCEIYIKDNGIGFEQKFAERIFKPFQRLHGRSEYEGTGMGLAICRKIVERHGGSIRAESEPEKGSTFIITLPVRQKGASGHNDR